MKRWNGWGDDTRHYPLSPAGLKYLAEWLGPGEPQPDVTFDSVVAAVPPARLPEHPLISQSPEERARHARGQSLPDWIALRSGRIGAFPDGVAFPTSDEQVRELLSFARATQAQLIPYGGGTSVVGHINPLPGPRPTLTVDMGRLNRLLEFDLTSQLATFEAGVIGPDLEAQLRARGFTLGHYPQSFEYSSLGGWIAARSSGQQSYYFGRIEDHFAGGHIETLLGPLDLPPHPASAAGPDLRHLLLGSEGRLGLITRAVIRVRPQPAHESFQAVFFHDWGSGVNAVREMAQFGAPVSMLRLSDPLETESNLRLSGKDNLVQWAGRALRLARYGATRCLLIYAVTGDQRAVHSGRDVVHQIARAHGGLPVGERVGHLWAKNRFFAPYLRNTLWEYGYAVDTFETAVTWHNVLPAASAMTAAVRGGLTDSDEKVVAFAHLSHLYRDGASIYVTYLFRRAADPDETLLRWQRLKAAGSQAVVQFGGTISHQHGVGLDHAPYLATEKGELGLTMLRAAFGALDPDHLLNPGKLLI